MVITCLRVRDWGTNFENNRTRELKEMTWFKAPNSYDGDGFTELIEHENGASHYGAWMVILGIASKCDPRGTLLRCIAGGQKVAHDERSFSRISRIPEKVFCEVIPRLLSIGWLERISFDGQEFTSIPQEGATLGATSSQEGDDVVTPRACAGALARTEWKGREGKGKKGRERSAAFAACDVVVPSDMDVPEVRQALTDWLAHKDSLRQKYQSPESVARLFKKFKTSSEFIEAVDHSIACNYRGVFAPGSKLPATQQPPQQQMCRVPTDEELAAWNPYAND